MDAVAQHHVDAYAIMILFDSLVNSGKDWTAGER